MKKVTQKDYQSFIQIYKGLPERSAVKAPKTEFVEEIAALCMCSTKTVRMWIHGVQKPDALWKSHAILTPLAKQDGPLWLQYD